MLGYDLLIATCLYLLLFSNKSKPVKRSLLALLICVRSLSGFAQNDVRLITQFINPCGNDGNNEFIIALAINPVDVGNLGFASINHTSAVTQPDFNWYWYGKNVINAPRPTFTPSLENCGVAGSGLSCYRLMDPGTPADATIIDNVRTTLNTIAGCSVFKQVPATGIIPGGLFAVFLGAGGCGLDVPATNLNFSNHCSAGVPTQQYYLVVGNGAYTPLSGCSGGFFVNASGNSRTSVIYNYKGGGNTLPGNYQTGSTIYTNGGAPAAGNAAVIVPNGIGGSIWLNNQGCVPGPLVILDESEFSITGSKWQNNKTDVNWSITTSVNYDYFVLERSLNGIKFDEIKTMNSPVNDGTGIKSSFTDDQAIAPLLYYRVKAVSLTGKTAYTNTKIVNNLGDQKIGVFPNPARNSITLRSTFTEELNISIYNAVGVQVYSSKLAASVFQLNTENWPAGFYTLKATNKDGRFVASNKFIKY